MERFIAAAIFGLLFIAVHIDAMPDGRMCEEETLDDEYDAYVLDLSEEPECKTDKCNRCIDDPDEKCCCVKKSFDYDCDAPLTLTSPTGQAGKADFRIWQHDNGECKLASFGGGFVNPKNKFPCKVTCEKLCKVKKNPKY